MLGKSVAPCAAAHAIVASAAAPAAAEYYFSRANPLTAYDDGEAVAGMYGRFFVEDGSYLRNNTHVKDLRADDHAVHETTSYSYYYDRQWNPAGSDRSPDYGTADGWSFQYDHDAIPGYAKRGAMITHVCMNLTLQPDKCSSPQYSDVFFF